jgi:hypothetical protein
MTNKNRVHVVIDGAFYRTAALYYKYGSHLGWINPDAFLDLITDEVAGYLNVDADGLEVSSSFYDGTRGKEDQEKTSLSRLKEADIDLQLVPLAKKKIGNSFRYVQKGVHELLISQTLAAAFRNKWDVLVLMSGSSSFVPFVEELKREGKLVLIAHWDISQWKNGERTVSPTRASKDLLMLANDDINISEIIRSEPIPGSDEINWREELFSK